jgi:hypothetical protein
MQEERKRAAQDQHPRRLAGQQPPERRRLCRRQGPLKLAQCKPLQRRRAVPTNTVRRRPRPSCTPMCMWMYKHTQTHTVPPYFSWALALRIPRGGSHTVQSTRSFAACSRAQNRPTRPSGPLGHPDSPSTALLMPSSVSPRGVPSHPHAGGVCTSATQPRRAAGHP